jgi:hypothetical protein
MDKNTGVEEKNFLDKVFEGLGSTLPFLIAGGVGVTEANFTQV